MILRSSLSTFSRLQIRPLLCTGISANQCKYSADKVTSEDSDWKPIYKLPFIRWVAAFNRLKVYQLGATALGVPVSFTLESIGHVPSQLGLISLAIGVTGLITLGVSSYFTRNLIGFIYVNKRDKLKLAYVDYWGRRNDVVVPVDDVVPLERTTKQFDFYKKVAVADTKTSYILLQKYGKVSDPEKFSSIFGE